MDVKDIDGAHPKKFKVTNTLRTISQEQQIIITLITLISQKKSSIQNALLILLILHTIYVIKLGTFLYLV